MDTKSYKVTGFDMNLSFDQPALEIISLERGSGIPDFTQEIKKSFDNQKGTISYISFTLDKTKAVQGSLIEILKINGKVKSTAIAGEKGIAFSSGTVISAVDEGTSVFGNSTAGKIVVAARKKGDVNGDGKVDIVDVGLIIDAYKTDPISDIRADLNGDGVVNIIDIGIVIDYYGK